MTTPDGLAHRLLLFTVGGAKYGCDISAVREIVPARQSTRLPGAPEYVGGLINLRGTIVTIVDLAIRLGAVRSEAVSAGHFAGAAADDEPQPADERSIVLWEFGPKLVGLVVDEVLDVQFLFPEQFEPAAGEVTQGGVVLGLGHFDDGVVILLDVESIIRDALA